MTRVNAEGAAAESPELSVAEVFAILRDDPATRVLDVREPWEREIASIPATELLTPELTQRLLDEGEREARYVFYCHHGIRSLQAAAFFASHGFKNAKSMRGGIHAWSTEIDASVPQY